MVCLTTMARAQVRLIVMNLSKKNQKASLAEMDMLSEAHGRDIRQFFMQCLLEDVDLTDLRSQKDQLKMQILSQETQAVCQLPHFTTLLCETFSRLQSVPDFVPLVCKALKLSLAHQLVVALALAQSDSAKVSIEGYRFLTTKLPDFIQSSNQNPGMPDHPLHTLAYLLKTSSLPEQVYAHHAPSANRARRSDEAGLFEELRQVKQTFSALSDSVLPALRQRFPHSQVPVELSPQLFANHNSHPAADLGRQANGNGGDGGFGSDNSRLASLINGIKGSTAVWKCVRDMGCQCTATAQALQQMLEQFVPLSDEDVCRTLLMMVNTQPELAAAASSPSSSSGGGGGGMLDASWASLTSLPSRNSSGGANNSNSNNNDDEDDDGVPNSPTPSVAVWNLDVFASVVQQLRPDLSWDAVLACLERHDITIASLPAFSALVQFYAKATKRPLPVGVLVSRPWAFPATQLRYVAYLLGSDPSRFQLSAGPESVVPDVNAPNGVVLPPHVLQPAKPAHRVWKSLDLARTLLQISQLDGGVHHHWCRSLFDGALKECTDLLLVNLAMCSPGAGGNAALPGDKGDKGDNDDAEEDEDDEGSGEDAPGGVSPGGKGKKAAASPGGQTKAGAREPSFVLRRDLVRTIVPLYVTSGHGAGAWAVLEAVARLNPALLLDSLAWLHTEDPKNVGAVLTAAHHLKLLGELLEMHTTAGRHALAVDLACLAAARDALNMEGWAQRAVQTHRVVFMQAVLAHVHAVLAQGAAAGSGGVVPPPLTDEVLVGLLKSLHSNSSQMPPPMLEDFKQVYTAVVNQFPRVKQLLNEQVARERFPPEVEERANDMFRQIFTNAVGIDNAVAILRSLKESEMEVDQQVYRCMIVNLFDEYRFFAHYPDMELQTAGMLFGQLIQHQLVPRPFLAHAWRYVLSALRMSPIANNKLFRFGMYALEQCKTQLASFPQFRSHVLEIQHVKLANPELWNYLRSMDAQPPQHQQQQPPQQQPQQGGEVGPDGAPLQSQGQGGGGGGAPRSPSRSPSPSPSPSPSSSPSRANPGGSPGRSSFATPTSQNIDTLLAAAEQRAVSWPSSAVQDRVHFIFNNVSQQNMASKADELRKLIGDKDDMVAFISQYLVIKRASIEPNFHKLYKAFLEALQLPRLWTATVLATHDNIHVMLRSRRVATDSSERAILKSLGGWLGSLTLAHNRPVLQKHLDLKLVLVEAYQHSRLMAVVPCVCKILDACVRSKVFRPPNPWLMGLLGLLREIYELSNLRLNLKFEVEMLHKKLGCELKEVTPTGLLTDKMVLNPVNSPDFVSGPTPSPPTTPTRFRSPHPEPDAPAPAPAPAYLVNPAELAASIAQQVIIPQALMAPQHQGLRNMVGAAVDRAIREIMAPVLERSVTIACMTTSELVCKDFATELHNPTMRRAAHLMVQNLAGSLALVTCKEPLRMSIANLLRGMLTNANSGLDALSMDAIVQQASNDNLELGCSVIERAATTKAMQDMDTALNEALAARRKRAEAMGLPLELAGRPPNLAIPDGLAPSPSTPLRPDQLRVYEDFLRPFMPSRAAAGAGGAGSVPVPARANADGVGAQPVRASPQPGEAAASAPMSSGPLANPNQNPVSTVQQFVELGCAILDKLHSVTLVQITPQQVQQQRQALTALLSELKATLGRCPPHHVDPVVIALGKVALHRFVVHVRAGGLPDGGSISSLSVGAEAHLVVLELLREFGSPQVLQKELSATLFTPDPNTPAPPQDHNRNPISPVAVVLLVCRGLVTAADANVLVVPVVNNAVASPSAQWSAPHLEWCLGVLRGVLSYLPPPSSAQGYSEERARAARGVIAELERCSDALKTLPSSHPTREQAMAFLADLAARSPSSSGGGSGGEAQREDEPSPQGSALEASKRAPGPEDSPDVQAVRLLEDWALALAKHQQHQQGMGRGDKAALAPPTSPECMAVAQQVQRRFFPEEQADGSNTPDELRRMDVFFRACIDHSVRRCVASGRAPQAVHQGRMPPLDLSLIDAFCKLVVVVAKMGGQTVRLGLLSRALTALCTALAQDAEATRAQLHQQLQQQQQPSLGDRKFDQRPYARFLVTWLVELNSPDILQDAAITTHILEAFASVLHSLQPLAFPGFAFAWMDLMSHRLFMPRLLSVKPQGWPAFHRLLVALFKFLDPCLRFTKLNDTIRLLYKGCLRILLVLLHDFPEFLCEYHFSLCDVIPQSCIQLRNLILSAFPRNMRLPDPFTPNLKVDLLPEIFEPPRVMSDVTEALVQADLKTDLDSWVKDQRPPQFLANLPLRLLLPAADAAAAGTKYNVPAINSLVFCVGSQAIAIMNAQKSGAAPAASQAHSHIQLFQFLVSSLDPEGRYLVLNAMVNQLRFPNNHTHYFSWIILYLFGESNSDVVKEQITRVLLERLIVHRPHPWGLLITFIELIKNPRYDFWKHGFIHCAPEIKKLFESVAATCGSSGGQQAQPQAQAQPQQ